jgi:hypothetical protein
MDGQEVEYVTSSVGDLLSIHVEYAHSSHKVIIKLPLSTTLEASTPLPSQQPAGFSGPQLSETASTLWSIPATVLAAISMGLLIYLKKRK